MSVITRFSVYTHCNDLGGKVWNPAIKWTEKYTVFVELENEQAVVGLGECWCFDSAPDSLLAFLKTEIAPHILGSHVEDTAAVIQRLHDRATLTARHGILASALSGVDIAVWDMRSQEVDLPLWALIKTRLQSAPVSPSDGQVRLYGSGGLYGQDKSINDLVQEMVSMTEQGFSTVKMKIGGLSLNEDINRVQSVLNALDTSVKLIVDGVYSYDKAQALKVYSALPAVRIEAFQSPLNASDLKGMRVLTESGVPVMAIEAEYREEIHRQLIQYSAVKYLQTAVVACGGVSKILELSELLRSINNHDINLSLEVSSTAVALMASCHYAAADNRVAHTEYHFVHQVFFDELPIVKVDEKAGWFRLTGGSGLGVRLPKTQVKQEFSLPVDR